MFRISVLSSILALALALAASASPRLGLGRAPEYPFADATIVSNSTIRVGDAQVLMTGFSRGSESNTGHTPDTGSTLAARTARNVCGETCAYPRSRSPALN
jgi:hypothetical protein